MALEAPRVSSSTASLSSTMTITISSKTIITVVLRVCFKLGDVVGGQIQLVIYLFFNKKRILDLMRPFSRLSVLRRIANLKV